MRNSTLHRFGWGTDWHLPHASPDKRGGLYRRLEQGELDGLIITGDVSIALRIISDLREIAEIVDKPVYFVLGNHDYYGSSIQSVRSQVSQLCMQQQNLIYLTNVPFVSLSANTALVGHDGWGDARLGNWMNTNVRLNDFTYILDLTGLSRVDLVSRLRRLGDEAAFHIQNGIEAALVDHDRIIVATHVPPFANAAWHEGAQSDPDFLPYFACGSVGNAVLAIAEENKDKDFVVLCGHTHGSGEYSPAPNVRVLTGGANYGDPQLQGTLELQPDHLVLPATRVISGHS